MTNKDDFFLHGQSDDIENTYLIFGVEAEQYAVNITYVTEIVGMQKISAVPDVPTFIKGVINLRGKVIPVMDIRLRFSLPWRDYDDRSTIIVLELDGVATGMVVDRVNEVLDIPVEQITPPPRWHNHADQGVIRGLGKTEESVYIILEAQRLLNNRPTHLNANPDAVPAAEMEAVS